MNSLSGSNSLYETIINSEEFERSLIESASPEYAISGSGIGIFKSQLTNSLVSVRRGITIIPIEDMNGEYTYCSLGQDIILIPTDQIIDYGWN